MAAHSSILAWEIPWTVEPGGPQFMGLQESDSTYRLNSTTRVFMHLFVFTSHIFIIKQKGQGKHEHKIQDSYSS